MNPKIDTSAEREIDEYDDQLDDEGETYLAEVQPICERLSHWLRMHVAPSTCPYAREAWSASMTRIYVRSSFEDLPSIKTTDPVGPGEVALYVCTDLAALSFEEFSAWIADQNRHHFGVWLTGIHPEDPGIARIPGHEHLHGLVIVKMLPLPVIAKAASRLSADGFYSTDPAALRPIIERGAANEAWSRVLATGYDDLNDLAVQTLYDERTH